MAIDPTIPVDPNAGRPSEPPGPQHAKGADFLFHLIDIINPLQHIPIVSSVYRKVTGDEIAPAARLIGGGLFAGPLGVVAATVDIVAEATTGRDLAGHAIVAFASEEAEPAVAAAPTRGGEEPALEPAPPDETQAAPVPPGFLAALAESEEHDAPAERLSREIAAQNGLAETILNALDKYQAVARERNGLAAKDDADRVREDQR